MGGVEWAGSDAEADAFFSQFVDAGPAVVARVAAERGRPGGDLAAVVAELREFGWWGRYTGEQNARRAVRQRADAAARVRAVAAVSRFAHPDESARLPPLPAESRLLLPAQRVARLSVAERKENDRFWTRMEHPHSARWLATLIRREIEQAGVTERLQITRATRAGQRFRLEQRAFERTQWQEAVASQKERQRDWERKRVANQ